jgi:hypothetical protein
VLGLGVLGTDVVDVAQLLTVLLVVVPLEGNMTVDAVLPVLELSDSNDVLVV